MCFTQRTVALIVIPSAALTQWSGIQPGTWLIRTVSLPGHYWWQRHWKQCASSFSVLYGDTIAALIQGSYAKQCFCLLSLSIIFAWLCLLTTICIYLSWHSVFFKNRQIIAMQFWILQKSMKSFCFLDLFPINCYLWLTFLNNQQSKLLFSHKVQIAYARRRIHRQKILDVMQKTKTWTELRDLHYRNTVLWITTDVLKSIKADIWKMMTKTRPNRQTEVWKLTHIKNFHRASSRLTFENPAHLILIEWTFF